MSSLTVLRTEREGVEFFTISETGESGMSQTGLARACGISQQAMSKLEKALTTKSPSKKPESLPSKGLAPTTNKGFALTTKASSKWLEPFIGKDLNLVTNYSNSDEKTRGVTVYTAEFCAAVIQHYAFKGNETAQDTLNATAEIGLTSYIQSVTGWLPEEFKAAPAAHQKLDQFLSLAKEWEWNGRLVIDDEGHEVDMSESWTFLQEVVFAGFTVDEYIQYEDENRKLGLRNHSNEEKIKLFFERNPETEQRLQPYTDNVQRMLGKARNSKVFYDAYLDAYGGSPTNLFERLISSAIASRRYKQGQVDRTEYADPRPGYSRDPDYMEGWNANTSANLVNK